MSDTEQDNITVYVALTEHTYYVSQDSVEHALRNIIDRTLQIFEDEAYVHLYEVHGPEDEELVYSGSKLRVTEKDDNEIVREAGKRFHLKSWMI